MRVARRGEQQPRAVRRAAGHDDEIAGERLALAVVVDDDAGDRRVPRGARLEPHRLGVRQQRDVGVLERRPDAEHLGVRLRVHEAREAVARGAAHAVAVRHVGLDQPDAARRVEGPEPGRLEVVGELLDARLVADRGERVRRRRGRLGRILAARAVDLVELLGERVVRLHLRVVDRPRGRDPVVVAQLAEVLLAQAVQRGAVELRGAADAVVHLRLERLAVLVVPGVRRHVAVVDEHVVGLPVLRLARQPVAALEQQDALARRGEVADERAAAGAAADDDDVVVAHEDIQGSCQRPWPATRRSASAGPHDPLAYGWTGGGASTSGCITRHASSTPSWRLKRVLSPCIAACSSTS